MTVRPIVAVVGSYNRDMSLVVRSFPRPGETITALGSSASHGGKGSNQAVQAARFGAEIALIANVGDDAAGTAALDFWQNERIVLEGILTEGAHPTGSAMILIDDGGQNMIVVGPGANDALIPERVTIALESLHQQPTLLLAQLETPQDATIAAFQWARNRLIATVLNAAPMSNALDPKLLELTDLLIVNEIEAITLAGGSWESKDALAAAEQLVSHFPLGVILTCGAAGAVAIRPDGTMVHESAPVVEVKDTTGAGDAFIGAFVAEYATCNDVLAALEWGVAAGSLSCRRYGAVPSYGTRSDVAAICQKRMSRG